MRSKVIFTLILACFSQHSFLQNNSCVDSSTRFLLQAGTSRINISTSEMLADSSVVFAGTIRDINSSDKNLYLSRIDKNNNILFSKTFADFSGNSGKLIELNNGDILLSAMLYSGMAQTPWLFRFTNSGNLVWQKQIETMPLGFIWAGFVENLYENNSGQIYFGTTSSQYTSADSSVYTGYYHVYKLDASGNGIWKTTLAQIDNALNHINAIKEEGGIVSFITQQYYSGFPYCNSTDSKSIGLFRLNDNNGSYIDSKTYCLNFWGTGCISSQGGDKHAAMFMPNGKIIIAGRVTLCAFERHPLFIIETDQNFNVLNSNRCSYLTQYTFSFGTASIDRFGQISIRSAGSSSAATLYATFKTDGTVIRQRKQEFPGAIYNGISRFSYRKPDQFLIFSNLSQNGNEVLQVMEFKGDNNGTADCTGKDTSFVTTTPHTVTPISFTIDTITTEGFSPIISNFALTDFNFQRTEVCSSISICDSLKISGNDSVCLNNPDQLYIATRNPGCNKIPLWKIDTSAIHFMQLQDGDTSVVIRFKRPWEGFLYAYSNSCGNLLDSFHIKVSGPSVPINLGRDTTFCNTTVLDAGVGFVSYKWQDNSNDRYYNVTDTGRFYVETRDFCGNIYSDTIIFKQKKDLLFIGNDSCIAHFPFTISTGGGFESYQWQDGSTGSQISITGPGLYYVDTRNGCNETFTDSILIHKKIQPFSLGVDSALCPGKTVLLRAPVGYQHYQWQDGSTNSSFEVTSPNSYYVTITDFCGNAYSDTIKITGLDKKIYLGPDISICRKETIQLKAQGGFNSYSWSPAYNISSTSSQIVTLYPEISTSYVVAAQTGEGCVAKDTITVFVKDCPTNFYVPSAFTPNNDGRNDLFKPIATAPLEVYEFSIYNRWGQRVFYSNSIQKGWDGNLKSKQQNSDVFVWMSSYKFYNQPLQFKKGSFILIR